MLNLSLVTDLVHQASDVGKAISSLIILSGNLCGLLAPIVTGYVVAGFGSYDWEQWIAGILLPSARSRLPPWRAGLFCQPWCRRARHDRFKFHSVKGA